MEGKIVGLLGTIAKHVLGAMRRAFIAIALTGLIVMVIAAIATEVISAVVNHQPPAGTTHLAAAAIAIAFGYAAAMTVAIAEILRGMIVAIELLVKESEKLAGEALKEGEVIAHKAEDEALRFGRAAVGDAATVSRDAIGLGGAVVGGIGHEAKAVEQGVGSVFHR